MINVEPSDLLKGPAKSMHRDWYALWGSSRVRDLP